VAGKTGTAEGNNENWFVGVTPEYSCAIWHGDNYKNMSPVLFARTMNAVHLKNAELKNIFGLHSSLQKYIYCEESGMAFSEKCTSVQRGYYVSGTELEKCNIH
jgi:membrane peptidoglycan carboxypeptidase